MKPKVMAFDVFGTVFDLGGVPKDEIRTYVQHIRQPNWKPLELPHNWQFLPYWPDAPEGIRKLREEFTVVTCSNGPAELLCKLSKNSGIDWDLIVPLEMKKVYKPNPEAYLTVCELLKVEPKDVVMVTANRTFGDLEAAQKLGMRSVLIRDRKYSVVKDILALSEVMW
jgi:2-haloalkanoic acid dehalogenase type II